MITTISNTVREVYSLDFLNSEDARQALHYYAYLIRETNPEESVNILYEIDKVEKKLNGY